LGLIDLILLASLGLTHPILLATLSLSLPDGTEIEPAPPGEQDPPRVVNKMPAIVNASPAGSR
jgi:hypothetical protein